MWLLFFQFHKHSEHCLQLVNAGPMLPFLRLKRWVSFFRSGGPPQSCQPSSCSTDSFQPAYLSLESLLLWLITYMTPSFPRGQLFPQTQAEKVPPPLAPTFWQSLTDADLALCQPSAPFLLGGCLHLCAPHPPYPQWCSRPYLELRLKFVDNFMISPQVTLSFLALLCP